MKDTPAKRGGKLSKIMLATVLALATMGCSVTSLQCGVDGESSFVNLNTTPKVLAQNARTMGELCSFAYQEQSDAT